MTDKKLKVNNLAYTELSIKIATLDMKLNKILDLLNNPEQVVTTTHPLLHRHFGQDLGEVTTTPQWPNETHTDYLKRIGQYYEAQSDNEKFEEFK